MMKFWLFYRYKVLVCCHCGMATQVEPMQWYNHYPSAEPPPWIRRRKMYFSKTAILFAQNRLIRMHLKRRPQRRFHSHTHKGIISPKPSIIIIMFSITIFFILSSSFLSLPLSNVVSIVSFGRSFVSFYSAQLLNAMVNVIPIHRWNRMFSMKRWEKFFFVFFLLSNVCVRVLLR